MPTGHSPRAAANIRHMGTEDIFDAFEAEFEVNKDDDLARQVGQIFQVAAVDAAKNIVALSKHALSESTRLSANKYIIDKSFDPASSDPIADLLLKLQEQPTGPEGQSEE